LEAYDWPGNVRELENTMERSVALETGNLISVAVLPEKLSRQGNEPSEMPASGANPEHAHAQIPEGGLDLVKHMQDTERAYIVAALEACGGVGTRAAELLRMSYRSFRHYSKKYNIN
jgi:two-component system response regulator PilR (NtrC family)